MPIRLCGLTVAMAAVMTFSGACFAQDPDIAIKGAAPGQTVNEAVETLSRDGADCAHMSGSFDGWRATRYCQLDWPEDKVKIVHVKEHWDVMAPEIVEVTYSFWLTGKREIEGDLLSKLSERFGRRGSLADIRPTGTENRATPKRPRPTSKAKTAPASRSARASTARWSTRFPSAGANGRRPKKSAATTFRTSEGPDNP